MRKAFIRQVVDLTLAYKGYPASFYGWSKPGYLEVWDGKDKRTVLHLPAVHKFKLADLQRELMTLECIGEPRESPIRSEMAKEEQLDLVKILEALNPAAALVPAPDAKPLIRVAHVIVDGERVEAGELLTTDPAHAVDALALALRDSAQPYSDVDALDEAEAICDEGPALTIDEMLRRRDRPAARAGMHAQ